MGRWATHCTDAVLASWGYFATSSCRATSSVVGPACVQTERAEEEVVQQVVLMVDAGLPLQDAASAVCHPLLGTIWSC
jgi:hypothetical protein